MSTPFNDTDIADALVRARRTGRPVDADQFLIADASQAYRVQALVAQALGWFGTAAPSHWKSGGPARDAVLTHAPLPPDGVWPSPADAGAWPFRWRGVEAEIAFRLGSAVDSSLAASLTPHAAVFLMDAMAVAIEMVDSRWEQALEAPAWHKLADLQSHGALVLGEWQPMRAVDWASQHCEVHIGTQLQAFIGSHPLGDPTWLLPQWLRHATRRGDVVPAGTVVTTGSWCGLPLAQAGAHVRVRFEAIGEASINL